MKHVSACGSMLTERLVRSAIIGQGLKPTKVVMHPVQMLATSMLYIEIAMEHTKVLDSLEDIDRVKKLSKEYLPSTLCGIPIEQDKTKPVDVIEFRDEDGLISEIVMLAVPVEFAQ